MMQGILQSLQHIIGKDAANRGMKNLIVPLDLSQACHLLAESLRHQSHVLILSGFPCCVKENPPTETDGPPGACAIARAAMAMNHTVTIVTDECNEKVFSAAVNHLLDRYSNHIDCGKQSPPWFSLQTFPVDMTAEDRQRMERLSQQADLIIACERAGPAKDGVCYTMRGIAMTTLVAPLHEIIKLRREEVPFIAIGDGGNELGMGKVIEQVRMHIPNGDKVGCVVAADYLVAASVSNWGGYALAAGAAIVRAQLDVEERPSDAVIDDKIVEAWIDKCLPSEQEEIDLLDRCVNEGCRDGVTGMVEATVDGMPLETSLQCLRDIRAAALKASAVLL